MSVGPVLRSTPLGLAIADAIQSDSPEARIVSQGSYVRIEHQTRCILRYSTFSERYGYELKIPSDLEFVMPSFAGKMVITVEAVEWVET